MSGTRQDQRLLGVSDRALGVDVTDRQLRATEDADLMERARSSPRAFAEVYELYRLPVYRYLRTRVGSEDEAADLTADTFERAMRAIRTYRGSGSGIGWLLRIARNTAVDAWRRRAPTMPSRHLDRERQVALEEMPEVTYLAAERAAELRAAVAGLPGVTREAIALRYAAGLPTREIAVVIGKSEAATQKLISRGLAALRKEHYAER
jgi:RNA polymerase sigma-70 factor (ECF subfamily)